MDIDISEVIITNDDAASAMLTESICEYFANLVLSGDWQELTTSEQVNFRTNLRAFVNLANMCREEFDKAVWAGHENGRISVRVESIRVKNPDANKPGRKAKELTTAEKLAARLNK